MSHQIPLIVFKNPESVNASINATMPSRQDIKENMKSMVAMCSRCNKEKKPDEVKFCSRCKIARYCSVECQRSDWPLHKPHCGKASGSEKHRDIAMKLAERAAANAVLMDHIDMYSILLFDLLENPANASRYVMHVKCETAPADIMAHLRRMMDGEDRDPSAQVLLSVSEIERVPIEEASPLLQKALEQSKAKGVKAGRTSDLVVLVYFTSETGGAATVITARYLPPVMLEYMASGPTMEIHSALLGVQEIPLNMETLREGFNNTIRMDKENKFKLRAKPHQQ
ncbi:hypothetical protein JAAARDRAFT_551243 [Jaapia argillacea MUCL 33604]|uniref:MYND-type domain-containing protein n=1 Tax=Jaapia argillacea MUCL 33604 TaxID=933084 RepID=A0A067P767_9AGAM|nr:hypothetical protein JAAARDRAFT_551243 [Jaapia argillacea MUCL 33604]